MNRNVLLSAVVSYIPRLVILATGPIAFIVITKRFPVETLGAYQLIITTCVLSTFVFTFGLQRYLAYAVPGSDTKSRYGTFVTVLSAEVSIYLFLVFALLMPLSGWLAQILNFPLAARWFWIAPALWTIYLIEQRILLFFGLKKRIPLKMALGSAEQLLYTAGLIVLFFVGTTVARVITAQLVAYATVLFVSLWFLNYSEMTRARPRRFVLAEAFAYGLPLILVDASLKVIQTSDRFMISSVFSTREVGLYGYAAGYMDTGYTLASPLLWSLYPFFADAYRRKAPDAMRLFGLQTRLTLSICGFAVSGLLVHRYFLVPLVSRPEYLEADWTFLIFTLNPIALCVLYLFQQILLLEKDTFFIGVNFALGALLNIALNLLFIPAWDQKGAALASFLSFTYVAVRFVIRAYEKVDASVYTWMIRFAFVWVGWTVLLVALKVPGQTVPWLYLVGTAAIALPLIHLARLVDFRDLWAMLRIKE